eukprot:scaffold6203_cov147-Isochrysis_galbana.AAC.2
MGASLQCDSADFPAAVVCLSAQLAGAANDPLLRLRGVLDDIETAYRQVPCTCPNFTVVCVADPITGGIVLLHASRATWATLLWESRHLWGASAHPSTYAIRSVVVLPSSPSLR